MPKSCSFYEASIFPGAGVDGSLRDWLQYLFSAAVPRWDESRKQRLDSYFSSIDVYSSAVCP